MWVYENHLGGYYFTEERQDMDTLYCEECGDSDTELGKANTAEEFWDLVKENANISDSNGMGGGMSEGYIRQVLRENFNFTDDDKLASWLVDEWVDRQRDKEKREYWYGEDEEPPIERLDDNKAIVCTVYNNTNESNDDEDNWYDDGDNDNWYVQIEVKDIKGIYEEDKEKDEDKE